jgi:hypothetical protein
MPSYSSSWNTTRIGPCGIWPFITRVTVPEAGVALVRMTVLFGPFVRQCWKRAALSVVCSRSGPSGPRNWVFQLEPWNQFAEPSSSL